MEPSKQYRDLKPADPAAFSITDRRVFSTLGVRIGALGLSLACLFSLAGVLSTYLGFDHTSPESTVFLSRTAAINGAAAALLAVICVYVAGTAFTRSISKRLERFNSATREAAAGNLDVRVDTPTGSTFESLARGFNAMMDRLSETTRSEAAQKQSLLAIMKAVESSGDAIAVTAAGRESTYYNKRFAQLFGYSYDELNSLANKPVLYADPRVAAEISQAVSNGNSWTGEVDMRTRDGNIIPVSLRTDAIKDEHGSVTGRIEIHTDITQRKRSELLQSALYRVAEMTSSNDDLQTFFNTVHRIIGELMYAGNFFIAIYDASTEMVSFPYFVDDVDETPPPRKLKNGMTEYVLRTGKPLLASRERMEEMTRLGQIEVIGTLPIDWLGIPLKAGNQNVGVLAVQSYTESVRFGESEKGVLTFVSQHISSALNRKRAKEALRLSEEKYRTIWESIEDGYFEVDIAGSFTFFNEPVCKTLGYPAEELMGLNNR